MNSVLEIGLKRVVKSERGKYALNLAIAIMSMISGFSGGATYTGLKNPDAAAFAYLAGASATMTLTMHILYRRQRWTYDSHAPLIRLKYYGILLLAAGVVSFVVYLVLGILEKHDPPFFVPGRCYFITCTWCLLAVKGGVVLFLTSRTYIKKLTESTESEAMTSESEDIH